MSADKNKKKKKNTKWWSLIFSMFCLTCLPVYGISMGTILVLLAGMLALPLKPLQDFYKALLPKKRWIKPLLLGVLFMAGVTALPQTSVGSGHLNHSQIEQQDDKQIEAEKTASTKESVKTTQQEKTEEPTPAPTTEVESSATPRSEVKAGETLDVSKLPAYTGKPYTVINNNVPSFAASELTTQSYEYYSSMDSLGRCGVAYACIGKDLMPTEKRGAIGQVKPSGWHTVKYDCVDGKYLYNRCHLIGYQLSGENANEKNLITGTRYMNVDGMLPFENMVADYVKETGNHVMYRVTPIFEGNNLVAAGVEMEAMSVEDNGAGILFHVYCYNVQPGILINYTTGESNQETVQAQEPVQTETPALAQTQEPQQTIQPQTQEPVQTEAAAVQNPQTPEPQNDTVEATVHVTDTGTKYHSAGCQYLKKSDYTISLADAKTRGLTPCSKCNPPQ